MKRWKKIGLACSGLTITLIAWGLIEPYTLDVKKQSVTLANLPAAWESQTIAQISDLQVGMWMDNVPTIRRSVETLLQQPPAAVLFSGDFIYHALPKPSREIDKVVQIIQKLPDSGIPTYAVLGNHDYDHKPPQKKLANQLKRKLEQAGINVLENEAVKLQLSDTQHPPLYLVGIGSHIANQDDVSQALANVPADSPRIVMMHNPKSFEALPARTAPLAIAGHTHGGQIRIPFLPQFSWVSLFKGQNVHGDGWIANYGKDGNQLYVNRGIGFSDIPIRINCAPELALFNLTAASSN